MTATMETPRAKNTPKQPLRKFRLLAGKHSIKTGEDANGQPLFKIYKPGDIIETATDLNLHNSVNPDGVSSRKYEEVFDGQAATQVKTVVYDLEEMSIEELTEYAEGEGFDIPKDAKDKPKLLKAIREARKARG